MINNKIISIAARPLAIGMVAALVLVAMPGTCDVLY